MPGIGRTDRKAPLRRAFRQPVQTSNVISRDFVSQNTVIGRQHVGLHGITVLAGSEGHVARAVSVRAQHDIARNETDREEVMPVGE